MQKRKEFINNLKTSKGLEKGVYYAVSSEEDIEKLKQDTLWTKSFYR